MVLFAIASMRAAGVEPPNPRALAVSSRGLAERQVLATLASVVGLRDEIEHDQQQSSARRPIALRGAVYGATTVTIPEVVRDAIGGMADERAQTLRVAAALDADVEEEIAAILEAMPLPSPDLAVPDEELVEAAHRALDAQDAALVAIAEHIERRAGG